MKTHWNNLMLYDSCCGEKPRCTSYPWGPTFEARAMARASGCPTMPPSVQSGELV